MPKTIFVTFDFFPITLKPKKYTYIRIQTSYFALQIAPVLPLTIP